MQEWLDKRKQDHYRDGLWPKLTQHGAMDYTTPPVDLDKLRMHRLARVRHYMQKADIAGLLLYDQLNCRYATDSTNMQIWCSHNDARYVLILNDGPVVLFDYGGKDFLSHGLPTIDEIQRPINFNYMHSGIEQERDLKVWADEIDDYLRRYGGGNKRIGLDRFNPIGIKALQDRGYDFIDGMVLMEEARRIKSAEELLLMQYSVDACEEAVAHMHRFLEPGITENALWSKLHEVNIAKGGEWIETRLLASGARTNPWFQECSMKPIAKGELVSFDTDLVGPYGYMCDMSRSLLCGQDKPNDAQRRLYEEAILQIDHNKSLLKPGVSFRELSKKIRVSPPPFDGVRYSLAYHGVGLCDEWPAIQFRDRFDEWGFDGVLEPGLCLCVEALVAIAGEGEAVKLEEQVVITEDGFRQFTRYPLEYGWL